MLSEEGPITDERTDGNLTEVWFSALIKIGRDEIVEHDGEADWDQTVQNVVGHTGALVEEAWAL